MDKKKCEYCGEEIHINTRRCAFCNSIVREVAPEEFQIPPTPIEESKGNEEQGQLINQPKESYDFCKDKEENRLVSANHVTYGENGSKESHQYKPLKNGFKVLFAALSAYPPGIGQLVSVIAAIIFMADDDADRKSYGSALLTSSLIFFMIWIFLIWFAARQQII